MESEESVLRERDWMQVDDYLLPRYMGWNKGQSCCYARNMQS